MHLRAIVMLVAGGLSACRTGRNYPGQNDPRYAGVAAAPTARTAPDTIRVVSFNVKYAERVDSAIVVLQTEPALRNADIVLLQEMDAPGTRRIAEALGMSWVYYPAIFRHRSGKDFGNAVLSRWPITDDEKIILPHVSRYARTNRIATAATIRIGHVDVRAYSTHLGTPADINAASRTAQLAAVVANARAYPRAIIGGDTNSATVGRVAVENGFSWPTERGEPTSRFGRWDHIFIKGFALPASQGAGTIANVRAASDHVPVWAVALLSSKP